MKPETFVLERYFAKYEFSAKYLLSCSDCESYKMADILAMADDECKDLWDNLSLMYTEHAGHPILLKEIASQYQSIGQENVLVSAAEEGVLLIMLTALSKGDHMIVTYPCFQSLYQTALNNGCEVSNWEPEEDQNWRFDPAKLEAMIKPNTKLIVVNFPHNPTGYLPTEEEWDEIIDIARRHNIFIFSDEMYRCLEVGDRKTLVSAVDKYEKAITLSGMSKSFGTPGLRIGWVVSQDNDFMRDVKLWKDYTTICASAPSEILTVIALRNRDAIHKEQLARLNKNLSILEKFMERRSDLFSFIRPGGGSVCMARLLKVKSAFDFCEKLVKESNIMLLPSTTFGFGDSHVRLGIGRENMPEVLGRLDDYLG